MADNDDDDDHNNQKGDHISTALPLDHHVANDLWMDPLFSFLSYPPPIHSVIMCLLMAPLFQA